MKKRVSLQKSYSFWIFVLLFLGVLVYSSFQDNVLNAPATPIPACVTTLPATIGTSINLCGNFVISAPVVVTSSNIVIKCISGTTINKAANTPPFDAIIINPNLNNVVLEGCNFGGAFSNAIHLSSGVRGSKIQNNIITASNIGIKEDSNSFNNLYYGNTIKSSIIFATHFEGFNGTFSYNVVTGNRDGVVIGTDPKIIKLSTHPGAICSSPSPNQGNNFPVICSLSQNGKNYQIKNNKIKNNGFGILTFGLDTNITNNTIISNIKDGVKVNSIYVGSEFVQSPYYPRFQEYFSSGVQILNNLIDSNSNSGINLNGPSRYFRELSAQFLRYTLIDGNEITRNGMQSNSYSAGIITGSEETLTNSNYDSGFYHWNEYTKINKNKINYNFNDGILLKSENWMTDILYNDILSNSRNGITQGTTRINPNRQDYPEYSAFRYIYKNNIKNNVKNGVDVSNGYMQYVILNEINNNNKGVYVPENPYGYPSSVDYIVCNDLSFNTLEGFDYDAKLIPNFNLNYGHFGVYLFEKNRVLNNGADGVRYYIDPNAIANASQYFSFKKTVNNHIQGNGFVPNPAYAVSGYGINVDGYYYHGFFANNFVNNNLGAARDTGTVQIENMWDESQYEDGYNNIVCKCGNSCQNDYECGFYGGTCVSGICQCPGSLSCNVNKGICPCYSNPNSLPFTYQYYFTYPRGYTPKGNFGLTNVILPSAAPPLSPTSCTNHLQCTTKSCESYPGPISNQQCGNGNFIPENRQFSGYYTGIRFECPWGYYSPYWTIIVNQNPNTQGTGTVGVGWGEDSPELQGQTQSYKDMPIDVKGDRGYIEEQMNKMIK